MRDAAWLDDVLAFTLAGQAPTAKDGVCAAVSYTHLTLPTT